ncbi:hypothetical protein FTUN_7306 [Frigoriglobus tundricola]|uniref:Uncharacterized protein n=1 Tax=Frigoriglobus tundricola TaxID=2774151 RepID=A0A6M5Z0H6_9BACT|nr:hypothetical protein FTUN_7306 [Frigoriglobus tundricola]
MVLGSAAEPPRAGQRGRNDGTAAPVRTGEHADANLPPSRPVLVCPADRRVSR